MAFDKPYTPQKDSLASSVCGFFRNNPDELLSLDDITDKFMVTRSNVHSLLGRCVETELLRRTLNQDGEYIYRPGARLPKTAPQDLPESTPKSPKEVAKAAKPRAAPLPAVHLPDIDEVLIEDGIPLPARGQPRRCWAPLLHKLQVGQSAELPAQVKAVLSKDITVAHAANAGRFTVKIYPDTARLRVWRVS